MEKLKIQLVRLFLYLFHAGRFRKCAGIVGGIYSIVLEKLQSERKGSDRKTEKESEWEKEKDWRGGLKTGWYSLWVGLDACTMWFPIKY